MTPEEIVARLIYRDGLMLVIDKPPGFAVHKGPKGGESLEDYFGALRFGLPRAPALAHRLDRDTSGCLVLGRHRKALAELGKLFKNGRIGKTYWAVVEGGPAEDEGRIDLPLGRKDATRGWWMKHDPQGQPSATTWKVMGRSQIPAARLDGDVAAVSATAFPPPTQPRPAGVGLPLELPEAGKPAAGRGRDREGGGGELGACIDPPPYPSPARGEGADPSRGTSAAQPHLTFLALEPLTGRTHQLRVHCAAMGWPIVGDTVYGTAPRSGGPGLHLHAREIVVPLYKNRAPIRVSAPVPLHMHERLRACGWSGEVFTLVD
jgi:tRNA pseudouridine32 synthase / 23S rRNA pseudouridine746 synthase